jgi:GDPmannose 4,6-dehydratase
MKSALVTGATGQDGFYLCEYLVGIGYNVHALRRPTTGDRECIIDGVAWHDADMIDDSGLMRVLEKTKPDEVYNLAAQSHVGQSFDCPLLTANVNAMGALRLLEGMRVLGMADSGRFYQASTSELYGNIPEWPQTEQTEFRPRSPYGVAKLFAYWATVNYRESYGMHASNGILFNHESERRGPEFVTRKIARAAAEFRNGRTQPLRLGNLNARRDWGHAKDYVKAMHKIVQQSYPDDYVIATGETRSVRDFAELAFAAAGVDLTFEGFGLTERGVGADGKTLIEIDPEFFRPADINVLCGDPSRAVSRFGFQCEYSFDDLVAEMVSSEIERLEA